MVDKVVIMESGRKRGPEIREFIIENLQKHPSDIIKFAINQFGCTRQAVHKHIKRLLQEGIITETGNTRNKIFKISVLEKWEKTYSLNNITEDQAWLNDILPALGNMSENVLNIWHYGFTEIFNNALDHSKGTHIWVIFSKTVISITISIHDNGVGIFKKIQSALGLLDERHAVLELAKGKLTTDPTKHSGEGIFFCSRIFDGFQIVSGSVGFSHEYINKEDWILQLTDMCQGTVVQMALSNNTSRTIKEVFDRFTDDEDYGFNKTIVPVKLTQYGDDNLVSRSQAKRMLTRIEKFKVVVFDFDGVTTIGQAFADEVFRVFARQHPGIEITAINTIPHVKQMISRAKVHVN
jgi:anti-sigma regulatory factor (Ser/Thr protein kinase)